MHNSTLAMGCALLCAVNLNEVQAQPVLVDIAPCMALTNPVDKQACYNSLEANAGATRSASNAAASAPVAPATVTTSSTPAPAQAAPAATLPSPAASTPVLPAPAAAIAQPQIAPQSSREQAVASFGASTPSNARVLTSTDGQQELHDRIANLQEREPGRYLITLESGQVWYQSNSQRFRLRKGMDVRIYPSPLGGSYRMARDDGEETGFVQVERLK